MDKVFSTYATRKGVRVDSLRFLVDGQRSVKLAVVSVSVCVCQPLRREEVQKCLFPKDLWLRLVPRALSLPLPSLSHHRSIMGTDTPEGLALEDDDQVDVSTGALAHLLAGSPEGGRMHVCMPCAPPFSSQPIDHCVPP